MLPSYIMVSTSVALNDIKDYRAFSANRMKFELLNGSFHGNCTLKDQLLHEGLGYDFYFNKEKI